MKATFITPNIKIVYLGNCDLIATSNPEVGFDGEGDGDPNSARFRNNPIWDDYE